MSTVKITELTDLTIPANTQNVILVTVDKSSANPVTKKTTLFNIIDPINQNVASAYDQVNAIVDIVATVDQRAVTSGEYANAAYEKANTVTSNIIFNDTIITTNYGNTNVYITTTWDDPSASPAINISSTWMLGRDGTLVFPDNSIQSNAAISLIVLQSVVASSNDFVDFQTKIAAL